MFQGFRRTLPQYSTRTSHLFILKEAKSHFLVYLRAQCSFVHAPSSCCPGLREISEHWSPLSHPRAWGRHVLAGTLLAKAREETKGNSDMILDGKNQSGTAAQQLLIPGVQLSLQGLLWAAARPHRRAARRPVGRQGRLTKCQGQVTVVTETVRIMILQLLLVLEMTGAEKMGWCTRAHTHTQMYYTQIRSINCSLEVPFFSLIPS